MSFAAYILTAFTLVLVIEGLLYALFTRQVRAMMTIVLAMPEKKVQQIGFIMAGAGFLLLALLAQN